MVDVSSQPSVVDNGNSVTLEEISKLHGNFVHGFSLFLLFVTSGFVVVVVERGRRIVGFDFLLVMSIYIDCLPLLKFISYHVLFSIIYTVF